MHVRRDQLCRCALFVFPCFLKVHDLKSSSPPLAVNLLKVWKFYPETCRTSDLPFYQCDQESPLGFNEEKHQTRDEKEEQRLHETLQTPPRTPDHVSVCLCLSGCKYARRVSVSEREIWSESQERSWNFWSSLFVVNCLEGRQCSCSSMWRSPPTSLKSFLGSPSIVQSLRISRKRPNKKQRRLHRSSVRLPGLIRSYDVF